MRAQNYNRYAYVYNNPLSHVDPSGFSTDDLDLCSGSSCPSYVGGGADTYYDSETGNSYSVTVTGQFPTQGNYLTGTPSAIDFAAINSNINGGLNALADRSSANGISTVGGTISPYTPLFRDNFAGRALQGIDYSLGWLTQSLWDGPVRGLLSNQVPSGRELMDAKMGVMLAGMPLSRFSGGAANGTKGVAQGATVFRVWGDEAAAWGRSWTTADPRAVANFRNAAGLPNQNTGRFLSQGVLQDVRGVTARDALGLHGNAGGLSELVVPNPSSQITLELVIGLNPAF